MPTLNDANRPDAQTHAKFCELQACGRVETRGFYDEATESFIRQDASLSHSELFESGAWIAGDILHLPSRHEHSRLLVQRMYWTWLWREEQKAFNNFKQSAMNASNPDEVMLNALDEGRRNLNRLRRKLTAVNKQLMATPESQERLRAQEFFLKRQHEGDILNRAIQST